MKNEFKDFYTVTEVVRITGLRDSKIKYLIKRGKLKATKAGWQWLIRKEDLEQFMKTLEK
jgi:excisionase family DNA binding protein